MQEQVRRPRPHAAGVPSIHAPVDCAEPVAHLLNLRGGDHVSDEASKPLTSTVPWTRGSRSDDPPGGAGTGWSPGGRAVNRRR